MQGGEGDGGQAEFVRVPQADGTMFKITGSDFSDEPMASLLALTDVMATGYHAAVSGFESRLGDVEGTTLTFGGYDEQTQNPRHDEYPHRGYEGPAYAPAAHAIAVVTR